ncbi:MAG TPA: ribosome small subunit-dependent GTPase A [Elusimicrobia bacterium]|nr:ribosome small subunit-dependent GTPase A [Elusimicrobiota bacterium]
MPMRPRTGVRPSVLVIKEIMNEKTLFTALVTAEQRQAYTVWLDGRELPAVVAGKLMGEAAGRLHYPVGGDSVSVTLHDDGAKAVVHAVLPRRSLLLRKAVGAQGDAQPLAANVDKVLIVMGLDGNYNIARLERLLVAAWDSGGVPVVVLTKKDLAPAEELPEKLAAVAAAAPGVGVFCVSSLSGEGVEEVEHALAGGLRCCLLGSSGAGKSTLLNRLAGLEAAPTGAVREGDARGRHTTTARHLYFLPCGGQVIDTPGVREFCVEYSGTGLEASFSDIEALAAGCRFDDCAHEAEPGCAVQAALAAGTLSPDRLKSYNKLRRETRRLELKADPKQRLLAKRRFMIQAHMRRGVCEAKRKLRGG